jgi:hypothetical protein
VKEIARLGLGIKGSFDFDLQRAKRRKMKGELIYLGVDSSYDSEGNEIKIHRFIPADPSKIERENNEDV